MYAMTVDMSMGVSMSLLDDKGAAEDDGWLIDAVVLITADGMGLVNRCPNWMMRV